jgi:hypothetical protein
MNYGRGQRKTLNRFGKKGTDKNIKITIDQLYEYFKSLNENEALNTDENHLVKMILLTSI